MADYIRREELIERILGTGYHEQIKGNLLFIARMIPAADAIERKKGTWRKAEDFEETSWFCSVCNSEFGSCEDFADFAKFCPECGAEMKGE